MIVHGNSLTESANRRWEEAVAPRERAYFAARRAFAGTPFAVQRMEAETVDFPSADIPGSAEGTASRDVLPACCEHEVPVLLENSYFLLT